MHPLTVDLETSRTLLVLLREFSTTHAPGYRGTINEILDTEERLDALLRRADTSRPLPRYKRRGYMKHCVILAWDGVLAGTVSFLDRGSQLFNMSGLRGASRLMFRWSDSIGARRPLCVGECSVCDRRDHETGFYFTDDQALCIRCVVDVVMRCNAGRQADEPAFTYEMLVELWTLDTVPPWRRTPEALGLGNECEVRAARQAEIDAVPAPVRTRWKHALGRFAPRLSAARESTRANKIDLAVKMGLRALLENPIAVMDDERGRATTADDSPWRDDQRSSPPSPEAPHPTA